MSGDADKGRPSRRGLTPGERELWSSVTRSIAPLRRARPLRAPEPDEPEPAPPPKPPPPAPEIHMAAKPREKPALAPLDRRLRQRLARGREPIDATIDLHGLTQAEAHAALTHFLRLASAGDARLVLVITGKGGRGEDFADRGVLRRQVPLWLTSRELRDHVIGFDAAHVAHGGDGALYVRVRRGREREEPR